MIPFGDWLFGFSISGSIAIVVGLIIVSVITISGDSELMFKRKPTTSKGVPYLIAGFTTFYVIMSLIFWPLFLFYSAGVLAMLGMVYVLFRVIVYFVQLIMGTKSERYSRY